MWFSTIYYWLGWHEGNISKDKARNSQSDLQRSFAIIGGKYSNSGNTFLKPVVVVCKSREPVLTSTQEKGLRDRLATQRLDFVAIASPSASKT